MARMSAATRTRKVRKVVGPGPHINSTPASHRAYVTTVFGNPAVLAPRLQEAFPDCKITQSDTGFATVGWPEATE